MISLDDPVTRFLPDFRPTADRRDAGDHRAPADDPHRRADVPLLRAGRGRLHRGRRLRRLGPAGACRWTRTLRRIAVLRRWPSAGRGLGLFGWHSDVLGAATSPPRRQSRCRTWSGSGHRPLGHGATPTSWSPSAHRLTTAYGDGEPGARAAWATTTLCPSAAGAISFAPDRMFDPALLPLRRRRHERDGPRFHALLGGHAHRRRPGAEPKSTVELMATNAIGDLPIMLPGPRLRAAAGRC